MADRIVRANGWAGGGCKSALVGMFNVAFKRAADQIAGAQAHGERKCEHDAAEENAKGQHSYMAADLKMVKDRGCGKYEREPFDAQRKKACVVELSIHCFDEH